jgi:hypothetical protein
VADLPANSLPLNRPWGLATQGGYQAAIFELCCWARLEYFVFLVIFGGFRVSICLIFGKIKDVEQVARGSVSVPTEHAGVIAEISARNFVRGLEKLQVYVPTTLNFDHARGLRTIVLVGNHFTMAKGVL